MSKRSIELFKPSAVGVFGLLICGTSALAATCPLPVASPEEVGMSSRRLAFIDSVVNDGLDHDRMPGCVVTIGRLGRVVFQKAYGFRQVKPVEVPMTCDTVFDMASLTKPIATATSILLLAQRGKIELDRPVARYLPEFGRNGKDGITLRQLLIHQGGLVPDNSLKDYQDGPEQAMQRVYELKPYVEPGTRFVYSDVGFIVLAEVVKRVSGKTVDAFSRENIFRPLGMTETGFLPNQSLRDRAAVTEQRDGHWMQGEVHDPRSFRLGGVAGHAGLFSTADDLAVFAQMLLNRGVYGDVRVLAEATVDRMCRSLPVSTGRRCLGWDSKTGYSSNRGDLFSSSAFGHGGFTGTSFWVDPELQLFVIFLSNRVHPDGKGSVNSLAGRIGTLAAAAIVAESQSAPASAVDRPSVLTGIDVLKRDQFQQLKGRRIGLITNHTGIDRDGTLTARLLADADGVELVALFSPEHGLVGQLDQRTIDDTKDPTTGLRVFSLYGETRKPTPQSLQGIDTLVFDIQDIGTRFYTYISTMGLAMQAASEQGKQFVVLDRPNPINGVDVSGPVLESGRESFVAFHRLPVRHGMTIGELARMFKAELKLDLDLRIVRMEGWHRDDFFDATGLTWINPSPNMRSLTEALLYPGIGLLETTNLSVGRGTDTPFEVIGAPWLNGRKLANALNRAGLKGVRFIPIRFTPDASQYKNESCGGVNIIVTDREDFHSLPTGFEIARQLRLLFPDDWDVERYDRLLGHSRVLEAVRNGQTVSTIVSMYHGELRQFQQTRREYLMY